MATILKRISKNMGRRSTERITGSASGRTILPITPRFFRIGQPQKTMVRLPNQHPNGPGE